MRTDVGMNGQPIVIPFNTKVRAPPISRHNPAYLLRHFIKGIGGIGLNFVCKRKLHI